MKIGELKTLLREVLQELQEGNVTGTGASFSPGDGGQYATPRAFGKSHRGIQTLKKDGYTLAKRPSRPSHTMLADFLQEDENPELDRIGKRIEEVKERYYKKYIPLLGQVYQVSFSGQGYILLLELTGDVPSNMKRVTLVIPHPSSPSAGWVGRGRIGLTVQDKAGHLSSIPLPATAVEKITDIYKTYTGQEPNRTNFRYAQVGDSNYSEYGPGYIQKHLKEQK